MRPQNIQPQGGRQDANCERGQPDRTDGTSFQSGYGHRVRRSVGQITVGVARDNGGLSATTDLCSNLAHTAKSGLLSETYSSILSWSISTPSPGPLGISSSPSESKCQPPTVMLST